MLRDGLKANLTGLVSGEKEGEEGEAESDGGK